MAQSCIADSFKVDANDKAAMQEALGGQSLLSIYSVYEKLKGAKQSGPSDGAAPASAAPASAAPRAGTPPTPEQAKEAEALKSQGNSAMAKKDYPTAIQSYTKALEINPASPIYLSNRAAAYSASHEHEQARVDAEAAVAVDPRYTKAWSRLGLARFALGDPKGSMEAYEKGIEYEGSGGSEAMKRGYETAKRKVEEGDDIGSSQATSAPGAGGAGGMPDLSGLASMLGGGGGGAGRGGGGGGPDLAGLMNNPMFASMAQNVMKNPEMMNNIMNNPRLRDMAQNFGGGGGGSGGQGGSGGGGGGGMPDMASLMQDPSIAEM